MTMLERMAAAMLRGVCKRCRHPAVGECGGFVDCDCPSRAWDNPTPIEQARAAVVAARTSEPTDAMRTAINEFARSGETDPNETWTVWLDAILAEVPK